MKISKVKSVLYSVIFLPTLISAQVWFRQTLTAGDPLSFSSRIEGAVQGYFIQHGGDVFELDSDGQALHFARFDDVFFVKPLALAGGKRGLATLHRLDINRFQWEWRDEGGALQSSDTFVDNIWMSAAAVNDSTFVAVGRSGLWLHRLTAQGKWQRLYQKTLNLPDVCRGIRVLPDGYVLLLSSSIIRMDTQGTMLWQLPLSVGYGLSLIPEGLALAHESPVDSTVLLSVLEVSTGQVIRSHSLALATAYATVGLPDGGIAVLGGLSNKRVVLLKTDALGNTLWLREMITGIGIGLWADSDGSIVLTAGSGGWENKWLSIICTDGAGNMARPSPLSKGFRSIETGRLRLSLSPTANLSYNDDHDFALQAPKDSASTVLYGLAPWLGGFAPDGSLHLSAPDYQTGAESPFQPGPAGGYAADFDRVWRISRVAIEQLRRDFEADGKVDMPVPPDLLQWPGLYNPHFTYNMHFQRRRTPGHLLSAPFVDRNGDGRYDAYTGDYPDMQGDEMVWWIMNDTAMAASADAKPIGVEIAFSAYGYHCKAGSLLDRTFFIDYLIKHKGLLPFDSLYLGSWADPDIGCQYDDYIGTLPDLQSLYAYNQGALDEGCPASQSFFEHAPIQSITWLNQTMQRAWYYNNSSSIPWPSPGTTDPANALGYYRLLSGFWPNGKPFTAQYPDGSSSPATHAFPGNPAANSPEELSMCAAKLPTADRRLIASRGPLLFAPGDSLLLRMALSLHPETLPPCPDISQQVIPEISTIRHWYDIGALEVASSLPSVLTLSPGDVLPLNATAPGATGYLWSNGATSNIIEVRQPGEYNVTITRNTGCDWVTGTLVQAPVSAQTPAFLPAWELAPNPVQAILKVACPSCQGTMSADLYSVDGRLWQHINGLSATTPSWDVSDLPPGLYWLALRVNNTPAGIRKLVKVW